MAKLGHQAGRLLEAGAFAHAGGVHVVSTSLWCDAARARGVCFVSRADVALGRGRVERLIATERTASMRAALGEATAEPLLARTGRPFALGRARLELLPSGRLPGAAQLLIELGGWRGLYAGSIATEALPGAEPLQVRACEELVLDAPQAGGVVDGIEALDALAAADAPKLAVGDVGALLAIVSHLGQGAVELGARWRKLGPLLFGATRAHRGKRKAGPTIRVEGLGRPGSRQSGAIEVRLGTRDAAERGVIALGVLPDAEALVAYARATGARRVHVRLAHAHLLDQAGARAFLGGLARAKIDAALMGAPEQLSLFSANVS